MFSVLGPSQVMEDGVALRHLIEEALGFSEEWLADLLQQGGSEHPWDTHPPLLTTNTEDQSHLAIQENCTVVRTSLIGHPQGLLWSTPSQVPDLLTVLLSHGHREFCDMLQVGDHDMDVRRPDYA